LRCVYEDDFIDQRHAILGIPSGRQIENGLKWDEVIDEVNKRQAVNKSLNKYVKLLGENNLASIETKIDFNSNQSYS